MHPNILQKILDRYIGSILCFLLGGFQSRAAVQRRDPQRILLIQLSAIGDTILTIPTIRAIRGSLPECTLSNGYVVYQPTIFGRLSLYRSTHSLSLRRSDEITAEPDWIYYGVASSKIRLGNRL